ncbi:hypothetical protein [Amycolatopsis nigrescens]|uniref:hypothetical protein n=1 Tax=Amycolatopsis nigrescens TaxID=381445 RepID=UPI00036A47C3|nr:hypothetical protein [Amycolatopsis nigrescens]
MIGPVARVQPVHGNGQELTELRAMAVTAAVLLFALSGCLSPTDDLINRVRALPAPESVEERGRVDQWVSLLDKYAFQLGLLRVQIPENTSHLNRSLTALSASLMNTYTDDASVQAAAIGMDSCTDSNSWEPQPN